MIIAHGRSQQDLWRHILAGFESEPALAVLVDIENLSRPGARNRGDFDIHLVLGRLAEKGRVVVKRAYADWSRYRDARRELMNAGLELIEMPSAREGAKNRADIKMAVDAMEIAYSRTHVTSFVIVSGDSDFTPLIGKLRELNKRVIGIGRDESSASALLIANCDEFYFYDSMAKKATRHLEGVRPDALSLLRETMIARQGEGDEHPQASAVKDSMRRRDPAFSESDIGFSTFSKFLEDAQTKGVVRLITDAKSGTYLVQLIDGGPVSDWPSVSDQATGTTGGDEAASASEPTEGRRRRRRRRSSDSPAETADTPAEASDDDESAEGGAEVFEWKVPEREPELPPIDQPLTYEDILLAPDEATAEAAEEPPTRGARRRRKALSSVAEPEVADLEAAGEETTDTEVEATAEVVAEAPADAEEAPAEEAEEKPKRRGRVKRGSVLGTSTETATTETPAAAEAEAPAAEVEAAAAETPAEEAEEKPKRRTTRRRTTKAAEPAADAEAPAAEAEATTDRGTRRGGGGTGRGEAQAPTDRPQEGHHRGLTLRGVEAHVPPGAECRHPAALVHGQTCAQAWCQSINLHDRGSGVLTWHPGATSLGAAPPLRPPILIAGHCDRDPHGRPSGRYRSWAWSRITRGESPPR